MRRLAQLGAEVASSLDAARAKSDAAARVRAKIVAREVPRLRTERRRRPTIRLSPNVRFGIVATLAVAAAIALTAFFAWPRRQQGSVASDPLPAAERTLSFVVGEGTSEERGSAGLFIAAPSTAETPVTFSDGSTLRLAPTARVRVAQIAPEGARVLVESGTVHVAVVHATTHETRWAVEAGPFEVRVTGTKFDVVYDPASTGLVVQMQEGAVFVRGCGLLGDEGRRLVAGERLEVSCKDKAMTVSAAEAEEAAPASVQAAAPPSAPATVPAPAAATAPSSTSAARAAARPRPDAAHGVIDLVRRGAHAEALAAAEASGFGATCDALSGPELLLLADAARYAGRFDRATEALEITRTRFGGSDSAATAAFELGRIAMDIQHDLPAAGEHFETYLRERPSGSLAREALGRALEARSRAGDHARAERLAVRYLAAYPDGPHAKLARKLTAPDTESRTP